MSYFILFSLKIRLLSPEFFSSIPEKFVWGSAHKEVYHHKEFDLQKGTYISRFFYQYPSHSEFVTQCSEIIACEIPFV